MRLRVLVICVTLLVSYAGATALLVELAAALHASLRSAAVPVDTVLGLAATGLAWLVLTWLAVGLLVCLVAAGHGPAHVPVGNFPPARSIPAGGAAAWWPGFLRRAALVLLGAGLVAAPASGAAADRAVDPRVVIDRPAVPAGVDRRVDHDHPGLDGWTPDRPVRPRVTKHPAVHLVATTPRPEAAAEDEVVVRRGDTLWDIAARHLGPEADAAAIAAEWPRWHMANRALLGPQPDLIRPGQRLRAP